MLRRSYILPFIILLILFIQGCASRVARQFITESQRPPEYERYFNELDTAVDQAGVHNAAYFQVPGFPYLRANRFLVSLKSRLGTDAQKKQWVRWMQRLDIDARETEIRNLPASAVEKLAADFSSRDVPNIIERSKQNSLGIPLPSEADQKTLLAVFAPVIIQDVAADYDKIGAVVWGEKQIEIKPDTPKVYYYFTHAYYKEEVILQLNYVFWYPARKGPNSPRIERGRIDGLTVRVNLNPTGMPFMVDFMNNCGCYHAFVPRRERIQQIMPSPLAIDAFVPTWLPDSFPQERLAVRLNSGWHQVENIAAGEIPSKFISYELISYQQLEMLSRLDTTNESMFTSRGIGKFSERIEPLIFFPMGIPDIGSMRQRGHHAIKFVGRAHFDDPHLFDLNFEFN